ncbi:MAG TPA: ABC transporter permease [Candidatus Didemnitutus sp.]|nr:ABC transporter permease [Candidatus Didemnitutus sp.]
MSAEQPDELVIAPGRSNRTYWRDLWRYRELLGFLAWRDIRVRYKQTVLGVCWALLQPAVTLLVFAFVFGRLAHMPAGGLDEKAYPLLVMSGLLPWQFFANALSNSSGSLVGNTHLISKVYFPRLVIPLSSLGVAAIDFLFVALLTVALFAWYHFLPGWQIVFLPAFFLFALLAALGAGLWLTALTVRYRDFRFIVPFLIQVGLFLSPVGFSATNLPNWQDLFALNPMVGVIDGFRWCLFDGHYPLHVASLLTGLTTTIILLVSGLWYFRRTERTFADIV